MLRKAEATDWEVFIQAPLYGPEKLIEYLGRYIFRIAISNHHILAVKHGRVTFQYYDNREGKKFKGLLKQMTLPAVEFIDRFLTHVLPARFVRIRHFGLHHGSCRKKLQQARRLLGLPMQLPVLIQLKLIEWLKQILQIETDPRLCPKCGRGILRERSPADATPVILDIAQRQHSRYARKPPHGRPFADPFHWAPFVLFGA